MKFKLLAILLLGLSSTYIHGQSDSEKGSFKDRLFVGGNMGLQFGDVTLIQASPLIGYKITEKFSSGIGITYMYLKDKRSGIIPYETNIYGGRVFSQYRVIENAMAYSEFEVLNLEIYNVIEQAYKRDNIYSLLVGGGYLMPIGSRSSLNVYLLWDVIEDTNSPYSNPIIRIGINAGL